MKESDTSRRVPATATCDAWDLSLWTAQVVLAAVFAAAGFAKLLQPSSQFTHLAEPPVLRFVGVVEIAGAIGLILPAATRIRPFLTAVSAVGFVFVMLFAVALHAQRGEVAPLTLILGLLAAFVAWGRSSKVPITPRAGGI